MAENRTEYTFDRVVRMVLTAIIVVGFFWLLRYLSDVLIPFAVAVVLAYLLNPLVTIFERKTRRRGVAVAITLVGMLLFLTTVVVLVVPLMLSQIGRFSDDLARLRADFVTSVGPTDAADSENHDLEEGEPSLDRAAEATKRPGTADELGDKATKEPELEAQTEVGAKTDVGWTELTAGWREYRRAGAAGLPRSQRLRGLRQAISGTYIGRVAEELIAYTGSSEFRQWAIGLLRQVAAGGITVLSFAVSLVVGVVGLVIVLLYLVFLLIDYPQFSKAWPSFIPPAYSQQTVEFSRAFNAILGRYLRGQALVALIVGTLLAVGYTIIGLPMAVPFGLLLGLLNMVPYLPSVGIVPAVMLAGMRAIGSDASFLGSVGLLLAVNASVQIIQEGFLVPQIMGHVTGLRPVSILLGLFIWGKLLGFLGLLLAIPLTCLFIAYYRRYVLNMPTELLAPAKKVRKARAKSPG